MNEEVTRRRGIRSGARATGKRRARAIDTDGLAPQAANRASRFL
jgi:hypothetical protein